MEENPLEPKEQDEQANMNYDNLFEFLDNPNHPTPDPAPTASNYFLKRQHPKAHYPYHCAHCARKYLTEYAMKRHMGNEHNVKFYKCVTCNEAFSLKSQLQVHGLTHIPEKNYKFPVCEQSFPNEKSVNSTMKRYRACSSFECHQESCHLKFGGFSELEAHLTKDHELDKLGNKRVCKKYNFSCPEQPNDAYNQQLFLVMYAYPNVIFSNLQSDPSSSSNSVSASSSASSSESEQNDKTTGTISPDLQQYQ
ncbi:unnamed protein product [Caenorhabditis brenneri]